jgi:hypothetical protein
MLSPPNDFKFELGKHNIVPIQFFPYSKLELKKPFASTCFSHVMNKVCQYAITNEKVFASMKEVFIKGA